MIPLPAALAYKFLHAVRKIDLQTQERDNRYDVLKTPCKRPLESPYVERGAKARLTETYLSLNPAALKRDMLKPLDELADS
ncbi:MAG: hypothetical protein LBE65_05090 [Synergistaceae bacterium]|jgi:hypothetical protein|nr:hypothetical protein [Synergistaceae bacterium]